MNYKFCFKIHEGVGQRVLFEFKQSYINKNFKKRLYINITMSLIIKNNNWS